MNNNFYDIVYHGYEWEENSIKDQEEYRNLMAKYFPEIKIEDAFDDIKGYRTQFYADGNFDKKIYYAFLYAFGFYQCSLSFLMEKESDIPSEEELLSIVKERWNDCLKEEYR